MTRPHERKLHKALEAGTARIGVFGLGYVGLPLARVAAQGGFDVLGFDIDPAKIAALDEGRTYIRHIPDADIAAMNATGRFAATADMARAGEADVLLLCLPTPLGPNREPDLSFVTGTLETILPGLREGQLLILVSTTYPGTTQEVLRPTLEARGFRIGEDYFLAYAPEREDPGNTRFPTEAIPKLVGADDPASAGLVEGFFARLFEKVVPLSSTRAAEAAKLTENIFRAVNIALVNELKTLYAEMDVDVWQVIEAASTKPFGFMPFYPGPGLGGHCVPIDPFYLTWKARALGLPTRFIELAGEINTAMPAYVVDRLIGALSDTAERSIKGARVLVLGLAYKKNVDDTRESPALKLVEMLLARGAEVEYHDPYLAEIPRTRAYDALKGRKSLPWTEKNLRTLDAALIVTDHDGVDYAALARACPLIVDTRNVMARLGIAGPAHIVKA